MAPTHILTTHHHADHSGGNGDMIKMYPNIQVIGGEEDQKPAAHITNGVVND